MTKLVNELRSLLSKERVLDDQAALRAYDCDAYSVDKSPPNVIVLPESTNEVQSIVQCCIQLEVPFTARGAGTGLSGGAMAALGGVVISTKRMQRVLQIDLPNRRLKAQVGIANKRVSDAVASHGLHFAPDPSSQSVSTLGGNIAENSGGPHTLKYGVTTQHILGLTLVDPSGTVVEFGQRAPGAPGYDFNRLIVGSEGTLGIVTEAWVRLTPLPSSVKTALVSFANVREATQVVAEIIAAGIVPAALEIMDRGILSALEKAFGLNFAPGSDALLLVECDSNGPGADSVVAGEMSKIEQICSSHHALRIEIAKDEIERQQFWTARKKGIGAMGRLAPTIVTHDGVIPRSKLPEMLEFVYEVARKYDLGVANLFHAGDGNLHPCFYFDDRESGVIERVVEAGEEIMARCIEIGGSISGEHGIGLEKIDLMSKMFSPEDLKVQALAKSIFSNGKLCNPCKVLPNQKGCIEHQRRWRGAAW